VSERQQLETLRRDQKTYRDSLAMIDDRIQQAEQKRDKLSKEEEVLADREETVGIMLDVWLTPYSGCRQG
jgi:structural maintenance of chromosome 1